MNFILPIEEKLPPYSQFSKGNSPPSYKLHPDSSEDIRVDVDNFFTPPINQVYYISIFRLSSSTLILGIKNKSNINNDSYNNNCCTPPINQVCYIQFLD